MVLLIDNYDSFTYNIYQYLCELGIKVIVKRNDSISITEIDKLSLSHIIISPGPGRPINSGISFNVIKYFFKKIPILGICLGHQAIGEVFGASIIKSKKIMHGKLSIVHHKQHGIFKGLKNKLSVVRYNSLVIDIHSLPSTLEITSWSMENNKINEIMGIKHKNFLVEGVQFHPESILSEAGHSLLNNFLQY